MHSHSSQVAAKPLRTTKVLVAAPLRCVICGCSLLLPNYLHQYSLSSTAIKLAIEDLLPWAKVQLTVRDSHNHFATHHLSLDVSIGIVFTRQIVMVRAQRFVWG